MSTPTTTKPGEASGTIPREGDKLESVSFAQKSHVTHQSFRGRRLDWVYAKEVTFSHCDFSSASIKQCYFRRAKFEHCNFTGCSISDSTFRTATFTQCNFEYTSIRNTYIEANQLLKNLPEWENVRRDLLRALRKNAESMGDVEDVRMYLAAEMIASAEHWWSAIWKENGYYREHHPGLGNTTKAILKFLSVKFGGLFWGHGESPLRLSISISIWIVAISLVATYIQWPLGFLASMKNAAAIFFGAPDALHEGLPSLFTIGVSASRYLFLGLLSAVLVRRYSRR